MYTELLCIKYCVSNECSELLQFIIIITIVLISLAPYWRTGKAGEHTALYKIEKEKKKNEKTEFEITLC